MKIFFIAILITLPTISRAQGAGKYSKPNDFSFYSISTGVINSPDNDAFKTADVWSGKYYALFGEYRFSMLDYIFETSPKNRFHFRDIIDLQLGVGYGSGFYANAAFAGGIKLKMDIHAQIDFGCNITGRFALDHMSYYGLMVQPFARYKWVMLQYGYGENNPDKVDDSQERKFNHLNAKIYLRPDLADSRYINFNYWQIQARNNQVTNPFEGNTQLMIGFGWQLGG